MQPAADIMRRGKSTQEKLYSALWHFSTNPSCYNSVFGAIYMWSFIKLYKLYVICHNHLAQKTIVQHVCDETTTLEPVDDTILVFKPSQTTSDRGLAIQKSHLLFKLEVSLVYNTSCQDEVLHLVASDDADIDQVCKRIFYKTYYSAVRGHGQIQLDQISRNLNLIALTHRNVRSLLKRCDFAVTWETHWLYYDRLSRSMNDLAPSDEKVTKGKHWQRFGFQGEDPSSDFRSVGELGLQHLIYFCETHPMYAKQMIEESGTSYQDDDERLSGPWYPFALCGIHVSRLVCVLLRQSLIHRQFLQAQIKGPDGVEGLSNALYGFLFVRCHVDWAEGVDKQEITSVLHFEEFFADFSKHITIELTTKVWENDEFHPNRRWW